MLSYSKKHLRFIFRLSVGLFQSNNTNTLELFGFRATANIEMAGGAAFTTAVCQIYGVTQEDMNDVTTLMWTKNLLNKITMEIYAIDENDSYTSLVFAGDIVQAWGYYQNMPDVYLYVQAQGAYYDAVTPMPVTSYQGSIDVAAAIQKIAEQMGYNFENNGVVAKISNLYAWDSGINQIRSIAIAAGIDMYFDNQTIAICNAGQPRHGYEVVISSQNGMIGYPTFDGIGVDINVLFNPAVYWGGELILETDIIRARGRWTITSMSHYLQSEFPNGQWSTAIRGSKSGLAITN
jgi:hypothetical protein